MPGEIAMNGLYEGRHSAGVDRYVSELLRCLGPGIKVLKPPQPLTGLRGHAWEQLRLPGLLGAEDRLWSPAGTGPLSVTRQAVTIHDVSVLSHTEWYPGSLRLWYRLFLPRLARRAGVILTVSEHSKSAIVRRLGVPEARVKVVSNGVNPCQFRFCDPAEVRVRYGLPDRYILYVGSLEPRKNVERLVQAWNRLTDIRDVQLVLAGRPGGASAPPFVARPHWRVRMLGFVPDEDLPALYAGALFFVMPSLYEGFGLSVLEAMACGAPVIASQAGALPEVTGQAALQVDPTSVEGMTEAIRSLLLDGELREELRQKGLERAGQFSWERAARQVRDILSADL